MSIRLGDLAPDFAAESTQGPIHFHAWKAGRWATLFSYPEDFTPVCSTELGAAAALKPEFEKRNAKVIGLSVDPLDSHQRWEGDIAEVTGCALNFPVIADPSRRVASMYGMIHPDVSQTVTVRSMFVISPSNKVELILHYPLSTGRNFAEVLRVMDSLQLAAKYSVVTPAGWRSGEDVIIAPTVSDEEARAQFPNGFDAKKRYLRVTAQPDLEAA